MKELVVIPEHLNQTKASRLMSEFKYAWDKTPLKDKISWCTRCVSLFAKVIFRRAKGLLQVSKNIIKSVLPVSKRDLLTKKTQKLDFQQKFVGPLMLEITKTLN